VTPRNVVVCTCGTGMLSRVSLILSFGVDSVKSMATVLVLLMLSAHVSVHSATLLMAVGNLLWQCQHLSRSSR